MMVELGVNLFGYPQIYLNDQHVLITDKRALAFVALLAVKTGVGYGERLEGHLSSPSYDIDEITSLLLPDNLQSESPKYITRILEYLSGQLGEQWIQWEGSLVYFKQGKQVWVDVTTFELALEEFKTKRKNVIVSAELLLKAVSLYSDGFLSGFILPDCPAFDTWKTSQAKLLHIHYVQALKSLTYFYLRQNKKASALKYAQRWAETDPLDEAAHRTLLLLFEQTGKHHFAIREYQQLRDMVRDVKKTDLEPETIALLDWIQSNAHIKPVVSLDEEKPSGEVTFVFTDIEGSTRLWETYQYAMSQSFSQQETIIRQVMAQYGGFVYKMIGDAFQISFSNVDSALSAAVETQRQFIGHHWKKTEPIKVRMTLHTCVTEERQDDYVGPELNRIARIMNAGYGGQILLSKKTADLVKDTLPIGVSLVDLGEHSLKDLKSPEHIFQVKAEGLPSEFPSLKTLSHLSCDLPIMTTPFFGRNEELQQIDRLLNDPGCRLVTLLGVGGTGKTRLAIQAAYLSVFFSHNVCFIPLETCETRVDLIHAIANMVKCTFQIPAGSLISESMAKQQLLRYLEDKRTLFILENFEQLVDSAELIDDLLNAAPKIKILVTSRERLHLRDEWVLEISGLSYPDTEDVIKAKNSPAVQLFIISAQQVSGMQLSLEDYPAIIRICQCLDGVHLGIELAASWVQYISCEEISREIIRSIGFLEVNRRGGSERHRTLRAVFDHSWKLLSDQEQDKFVRLGIFSGDFNRVAAQEVAWVSILLLAGLVDKSLIRRVEGYRYEIHPVLKGYLREKLLSDSELYNEVKDRHAQYFGTLLLEMEKVLKSHDQLSALKILRMDIQEIFTSIRWFAQNRQYEYLEKLLPVIILFSVINDQFNVSQEVKDILLQLKETISTQDQLICLYTLVLSSIRYFSLFSETQIDYISLENEIRELLPSLPNNRTKAYTLILECVHSISFHLAEILSMGELSLSIFHESGDVWEIALNHLILGDIHNYKQGDPVIGKFHYQASLKDFEGQGNPWGLSLCHTGLMDLANREGDLDDAYFHGKQAKDSFTMLDNKNRLSYVNEVLGNIALRLGKWTEARGYFEETLAYFKLMGDKKSQQRIQQILDEITH